MMGGDAADADAPPAALAGSATASARGGEPGSSAAAGGGDGEMKFADDRRSTARVGGAS